jgi:hypothetical protein
MILHVDSGTQYLHLRGALSFAAGYVEHGH